MGEPARERTKRGRTAQLIGSIVKRAEEIDAMEHGQIVVNWGGREVKVTIARTTHDRLDLDDDCQRS